jgi:hypothetical protein
LIGRNWPVSDLWFERADWSVGCSFPMVADRPEADSPGRQLSGYHGNGFECPVEHQKSQKYYQPQVVDLANACCKQQHRHNSRDDEGQSNVRPSGVQTVREEVERMACIGYLEQYD